MQEVTNTDSKASVVRYMSYKVYDDAAAMDASLFDIPAACRCVPDKRTVLSSAKRLSRSEAEALCSTQHHSALGL